MRQDAFNLDALTDIVSNGIGMLILLCLVAVVHRGAVATSVDVPIQRVVQKTPHFVLCKDDRLLILDVGALGEDLVDAVAHVSKGAPFHLAQLNMEGELLADKTLALQVNDTSSWPTIREALKEGSGLHALLESLDPSTDYVFAFVYDAAPAPGHRGELLGAGYGSWAALDELLGARGFDRGWMPVTDAHRPFLCPFGDNVRCDFRPFAPVGDRDDL